MGSEKPQGTKIPLIFIGVAILVIATGIFVRSRNSSPSQPPESEPAPVPEPTSALAPEPEPMPAQSPESMPAKSSETVAAQSPEPKRQMEPQSHPEPQIRFSSLAAKDDDGNNWRLGLKAIPPQVPEGTTESGEPLIVRADVRGAGRYISIGLLIQGQAGEIYEPGAARNGRLLPAPTFKVFDESGKIIGSGSFEYG